MSKHTTWPWMPCGQGTLVHPVTGAAITTEVIEAKGWGRIGEWYDYSNDPEANFQLIIAAPELLEAGDRLQNYLELTHLERKDATLSAYCKNIRAAIAKATGETP